MTEIYTAIESLVTANRILAHEGVVDAYGHVSIRHPQNPDHFLLARSRSPELIELDDMLEFTHECECIDDKGFRTYLESPIHGPIYKEQPDVQSVVYNHSYAVVPFSVSKTPLRPIKWRAVAF